MFLFGHKKPIGIYLNDDEIALVRLEKAGETPELSSIYREELPQGAVAKGLIQDAEVLLPLLLELRQTLGEEHCRVALPVNKSYAAVMEFPAGLNDEEIHRALAREVPKFVPLPLEALHYETGILRGQRAGKTLVFFAGLEREIADAYESIFKRAGWEQLEFLLENLVLGYAIPMKWSSYPSIIFLHAFSNRVLMSSVYHGYVFDGLLSYDLTTDFPRFLESYREQIGEFPAHVVLSGDAAALAQLESCDLPSVPRFVSAQPRLRVGGEEAESPDLLVATGLAVSGLDASKKGGIKLLSLLD